ncbi:tripartite motif-containing protein 59-like isoform X2 [Hydractinia symbiolongicarpus]|uniref:tripartite motif-containing protein 59-like isoform X2 n=1 Tax=Hydractinia symbiolongicarpus TaxID=13093 RepID=UPI00254F6C92|nr:tripartite motif-containing protein 59-like isoform X2 [Hydractinia symbiolongicarpus]
MAMSKEELCALLECKICLDTYEEPKNLPCGHTYCKNCIDSILIFKENGSAEIPCPFKCELTVAIDESKTTSSLPTNFPLSNIIEEAEKKQRELTSHQGNHCQQNKQCNKEVNFLCITCGVKICNQCQKAHSCKLKSFISVTFDKKLEETRPLCQQHMSHAKQVCLDCANMFICVYCANREHKDHMKKGIVEFGEEVKTWFKSFTDTFEDTKIVLENITKVYNKAMMKFWSEREKLVQELEIRKFKRLGQFLELLNTEHKNILNQFDKKTQEFRQIIFVEGYTDSTKVNQASEYINTLELKTHFELVAEKTEIEQQLHRLTVFPTIVPCFNFHLSVFNNGNLYVNPLGEVNIAIDFVNTASVESGDKDVYANNIAKNSIQGNQLEIKRNFLDLVEDLNVNERLTSVAKVVKRPQKDANLKSTPTLKKFDQFDAVEHTPSSFG